MYLLIILVLGVLPPVLAFYAARLEGAGNVASPLKVLGWTLLLGYTLKSLYLIYALSTGAPFRTEEISRDVIHIGQLATVIGTLSFLFGYVWFLTVTSRVMQPIRVAGRPTIDPRLLYYPLLGISIALMVYYFVKMGFVEQLVTLNLSPTKFFIVESTGVTTSLGYLTIGGDLIMVFAVYYFVFAKRLSLFNIYTLSILFIGLCYFMASRRNGVLIMIILFLLIVGARRLNLRRVLRAKHYIAVGCVLLVLSFASQIRKQQGASVSSLDLGIAIEVSIQHAMEGAYFLDPAKTAAIMREADRQGIVHYGDSFVRTLLVPVPRVLWPEKPAIRMGPYVAQDLLGIPTQSGIPPGVIGELYINFRWPGIVLGMGLLGLLSAVAWRRMCRVEDPRFARPPYALAMMCLILFLVGDFSVALITFVKYQIAIAVCSAYWRRQSGHMIRTVEPRDGAVPA